MKVFITVLLILYVIALHVSMAGMEIIAWAIILPMLTYHAYRRDWVLLRKNKNILFWQGVMTLAVLGSLLATPLEKPFMFQFGFMRWVFVLWGMTLALHLVWSPRFEFMLLRAWMWVLLLTGAYGVLQCLTGIDFVRDMAVYLQGDGVYKAVGFFSLSMTYAYSIGISLMAYSIPALHSKYWLRAIVTCVFGLLGVITSMSRGAWLAVAFCVFIYLAWNHRRYLIPVALGILLMGTGLYYYSLGFASKIHTLAELHLDNSSSVRVHLWRGYWQMFLDHPWFGVGIFEGDKLLPEIYQRLGIVQRFVSHAHSNYLQWLGGAGIFGFVSYISICWIFLTKAWKLRSSHFSWGWSLFLAQMFLHFGGLTEANFINAVVNHFLVFCWALILVLECKPNATA